MLSRYGGKHALSHVDLPYDDVLTSLRRRSTGTRSAVSDYVLSPVILAYAYASMRRGTSSHDTALDTLS